MRIKLHPTGDNGWYQADGGIYLDAGDYRYQVAQLSETGEDKPHIGNLIAKAPKLLEALEPFAHADLSELLGGNVEGDDSIVFQKKDAKLTIGDFRRARELVLSLTKETK